MPYFEAGLKNNEYCICVASEPLNVDELREVMRERIAGFDEYLKKGQVEIIPHTEWYIKDGVLDLDSALAGFVKKLEMAIYNGYAGLRTSGNTHWLEKRSWDDFLEYENKANAIIGGHRMLALCTYSLDRCGAGELLDVAGAHQIVLIKHDGEWKAIENTEAKDARKAQFENELKFRYTFDQSPIGAAIVSLDHRFQRVNEEMCRFTGYSSGELLGMKFTDITHRDDVESSIKNVKKLLAGDVDQFKMEKRYMRKDGTVAIGRTSVRLVKDPSGKPLYFLPMIEDITERKQAEDMIRNKQKELQAFIDGLPGYAFTKDRSGRALMVNRKFCDDLGFSYDGPIGKTNYDLFPKDLAEKYTRDDERVFETGEPLFIEEEALVRGKRITVATRKIPLKDEKGRVTGLIGLGFDITELKRAERALKESEEKYRFLVENSKDVIWKIDLQGRWTFVSGNVEKMIGYRADEIVGKTVWDFVAPECHDILNEKLRKRMRGEEIPPYELRIINREGYYTPFEVLSTPILDKNGKIVGIQGISRDITLRKRAEKALLDSEQRLSLAQQAGRVGVFDWDLVTNMAVWTPELEDIFGIPHGTFEKVYDGWARRVHPDDLSKLEWFFREWILSGREEEGWEYRILRDGQVRWIAARGRILYDHAGKPLRMIGTNLDITERKQTELELKSAKAQAELYLDLMSHDINNMNQVGIGFLELALDMLNLDENGRSIISRSMGALESSSRLIDNVRRLQKARSGELNAQEIDLGQTLGDVCDYFTRIQAGEVTINYEPVTGCKVMANDLLYDVLSNIVDNAIKHAKDGPVVNIRLEEVDECDETFYKVTIEDNGRGVPEELKSQIFDRFHRGNTKAKGKGLGLYLAKTLVESYNGRVWVEDRVLGDHTQGSKFIVLLPALPPTSEKREPDFIVS